MKKLSGGTLRGTVPTHQNVVPQGCLLCILVCPTVVAKLFCLQSSHWQQFSFLVIGRVWSLFCQQASVWPPWVRIESEQAFARGSTIDLQGTFLVLSPQKFQLVVGPAVRPSVCLQPPAGAAIGQVCVVIFPSPWGRSHFGVVIASVLAACSLSGLRHYIHWALSKDIFKGTGWQGNVVLGCILLAKFREVWFGRRPRVSLENSCHRAGDSDSGGEFGGIRCDVNKFCPCPLQEGIFSCGTEGAWFGGAGFLKECLGGSHCVSKVCSCLLWEGTWS